MLQCREVVTKMFLVEEKVTITMETWYQHRVLIYCSFFGTGLSNVCVTVQVCHAIVNNLSKVYKIPTGQSAQTVVDGLFASLPISTMLWVD